MALALALALAGLARGAAEKKRKGTAPRREITLTKGKQSEATGRSI